MVQLYPQWIRIITTWQDDGFGNVVSLTEVNEPFYNHFLCQEH